MRHCLNHGYVVPAAGLIGPEPFDFQFRSMTLNRQLKLRQETEAIPVLLLTAHAIGEVDIVRSVEAGAIDHLVKPFSGPVLVAKVKATCERAFLSNQCCCPRNAQGELRRSTLSCSSTRPRIWLLGNSDGTFASLMPEHLAMNRRASSRASAEYFFEEAWIRIGPR